MSCLKSHLVSNSNEEIKYDLEFYCKCFDIEFTNICFVLYFHLSLRRIGPLTSPLHLSLSLATLDVWVWNPRSFLSLSMVLLQASLGQPLLCPWNGYFCVPGVIHSQYMSQPFPPSSLDDNAYLFHFSPCIYSHVYVLYGSIIAENCHIQRWHSWSKGRVFKSPVTHRPLSHENSCKFPLLNRNLLERKKNNMEIFARLSVYYRHLLYQLRIVNSQIWQLLVTDC